MTETCKVFCNECQGIRNHWVQAEHTRNAFLESVPFYTEYNHIVECCGCENISFLRTNKLAEKPGILSSLMKMPFQAAEESFPPPLYRRKPNWFDDLPDPVLQNIFEELYRSLQSESHFLATFGARTVIDRLIVLTVGDQKSFPKALNKLQEEGMLSRHERDILQPTIDAGHAAAHRGYAASSEELETILNTIEGLVHRLLVLPAQAEALKDAVPDRNGKIATKSQINKIPEMAEKIKKAPPKLNGLYKNLKKALEEQGDDVSVSPQKHYIAYRRMRNFAAVELRVQKNWILMYLNIDPDEIEIEDGFTRDVRAIGHYGTGNLEVVLRSDADIEKASDLIKLSYANS